MSEKTPINDAMDHMKNVEGFPTDVDLKKLPKPLRYFGYFFIGFFALSLISILLGIFFN
ncbi:amino acid transporter [Metabacillus idriensis]|uniref:amino acid transporter n=1 Tax=Metabacillus idriensis TaxID=324768 RepID=UPI0028146570|nr:amino acid transporter [Metabacillus idriensis]MDR0137867.1 amino acid transporter [Metabacillus idriensis]